MINSRTFNYLGYRSISRSNTHPQQLSSYQQYSPPGSNRIYSSQKAVTGSNNSQYQLASKVQQQSYADPSSMVLPWKETATTRRHEMLISQFQDMPKEKMIMKGNILLCVENMFVIGKRWVS